MATLLLVDDNSALRDLLEETLVRHGFRVISANGPSEAIEAMRRHEGAIDLAVVDVVLPQMRCDDCISELRSVRPDLKVLYMSGYPREVAAAHGGLRHDDPFIMKPFTPAALIEAVKQALGQTEHSQAAGEGA
ncbi:MAG: response regulator [bacterium]|jgi:two-component system cell cycle sensor histidine kinase/response regulator CckA